MATFFPASVSMLTLLPTGSSSGHRPMTPMARERAREKVYAEASGDIANAGGIEKKSGKVKRAPRFWLFPLSKKKGSLSLSLSPQPHIIAIFCPISLCIFYLQVRSKEKRNGSREEKERERGKEGRAQKVPETISRFLSLASNNVTPLPPPPSTPFTSSSRTAAHPGCATASTGWPGSGSPCRTRTPARSAASR